MRTHISPRTPILTTAVVVALFTAAAPAQAQFGKLKKLGGEIARETVGLPPKSESRDYTITAERLDGLLAVIEPLAASAKRESAAKEARDAYLVKRKAWERCVSDASKAMTSMNVDNVEKSSAILSSMGDDMMRLSALRQAKRLREVAYLEDSLNVTGIKSSAAMAGAKCGAPVYKPAALIEAEVDAAARYEASSDRSVGESGSADDDVTVPEKARHGLTSYQWGMIRERVALYAISLIDPAMKSSKFTDGERSALDARGPQLKSLAPYFQNGTLRWTTWGDVKQW